MRLPSSSQRLFCADLIKATKCRSTSSVASGAMVSPRDAAEAWAWAIVVDVSINSARGEGESGVAEVMRLESGVSGAGYKLSALGIEYQDYVVEGAEYR